MHHTLMCNSKARSRQPPHSAPPHLSVKVPQFPLTNNSDFLHYNWQHKMMSPPPPPFFDLPLYDANMGPVMHMHASPIPVPTGVSSVPAMNLEKESASTNHAHLSHIHMAMTDFQSVIPHHNNRNHSSPFDCDSDLSAAFPPLVAHSDEHEIGLSLSTVIKTDSDDCESQANKSESEIQSSTKQKPIKSEKPLHVCTQADCSKTFKYKSHLQRHLASHSKAKPFQCDECGKCFGHRYYLQDHIRYNHQIDGSAQRKHVCSECGKSFRLKINLINHFRIHSGEKPFTCSNCPKTFTQKGNRDAHERACKGIKPYVCTHCDKAFTRKMYLQQHERTHSGEKPFKCDFEGCSKTFAINSNMKKHRKTHFKK